MAERSHAASPVLRSAQRLGDAQHARERQIAELQRIAEQHELVGSGQRADEPPRDRGVAQEIDPLPRADVQVGDDDGAQAAPVRPSAAP
jgi:hypothetical protein